MLPLAPIFARQLPTRQSVPLHRLLELLLAGHLLCRLKEAFVIPLRSRIQAVG